MIRSLALACVLVLGGNAAAAIITWEVDDGGNGHAYEFVDEHLIWTDAKAAAETRSYLGVQGHLVTLTSAAENEFVFDFVLPLDARAVPFYV